MRGDRIHDMADRLDADAAMQEQRDALPTSWRDRRRYPVDVTPQLAERFFELERQFPAHSARKEEQIRARFGLPAVRYYQVLFAMCEAPVGLELDAELCHRITAARDRRKAERASRRFTRRTPQ